VVKNKTNIPEILSDDFSKDIGDQHIATSLETPLKDDAFDKTPEEKIEAISEHFAKIMGILGLDLSDDSLSGTPKRVAKMYVNEIFSGLNPDNQPGITLFENKYEYHQMLVEKKIPVQSMCEHHFQPIIGTAAVAYIPNGKVIGLSKLNRIVEFYARRPQVQERLTNQIGDALKKILNTKDVAVYLDAKHMCVEARGIKHAGCSTITSYFSGKFLNEHTQNLLISAINS